MTFIRLTALLLGLSSIGFPMAGAAPLTYYVAPSGSDTNAGTQASPFATLARARDAIRTATGRTTQGQTAAPSGWQGANVVIRGGTYYQGEPLTLDGRDSGTSTYRVVFKSYTGETPVISGGVSIPAAAWKTVRDPLLRARLAPSVRDSVRILDLRSIGIKDLGQLGTPGSRIDLIVGGVRATPAEWPNGSWAKIGQVGGQGDTGELFLSDDRPKRWAPESGLWMHGYWAGDDADSWHKVSALAGPTRKIELSGNGPDSGISASQWLRAINVLEELDTAGEWWVDTTRAQLLLLPANANALGDIVLSFTTSLVIGNQSSWVSFTGVRFEATRSHAVEVSNATGFVLDGVTIKNAGGWGVRVNGGSAALLKQLTVSGTGQGGVHLSGGDRTSLTESGHVLENSTVSDFGNVQHSGAPGVSLVGVGATVTGCTIQDGPQAGLSFTGNEHEIKNSTFRRVCRETGSMGAITALGDWTTRGTVISGNTFQTIRPTRRPTWAEGVDQPPAIALKTGTSGITVSNNSITDAGSGILIDGGRDNAVSANTFSQTDAPILVRSILDTAGLEANLRDALAATTFVSNSTWSSRYPKLANLLASSPASPINNALTGNRVTDAAALLHATESARTSIDVTQVNLASNGSSAPLSSLLGYEYALPSPEPTFDGLVFYVAVNGSDSNSGTENAPFATLEAARNAIRSATGRSTNGGAPGGGWKGARIILKSGTYHLSSQLKFDERDSGTESAPVQIVAASGATPVISGAAAVPDSAWQLVDASSDSTAYGRIPTAARGKVYRVNVNALGIDKGSLGAWMDNHENMLRLIVGGSLKRMSRYPSWPDSASAGWKTVSNIQGGNVYGVFGSMSYTIADATPAGWNISGENVFVYGSLDVPYHVRWQPVSSLASDGQGGTRIQVPTKVIYEQIPVAGYPNGFVAIRNSLGAMTEGSYVWARDWGNVYYWSPSGAPTDARLMQTARTIQFGVNNNASKSCNWVQFEGIVFDGARRSFVDAYSCTGIRFYDCEMRNFGYRAAELVNCTKSGFSGGSIHDGAQCALILHGGDFPSLTRADNFLKDVEVYEIGFDLNQEISVAVSAATSHTGQVTTVAAKGCGLTISGCTFRDIRDGVLLPGAAHLVFENNVVERCSTIVGDAGQITIAADYSLPGFAIRGNTFRNNKNVPLQPSTLGQIYCLYLDGVCGVTIEDNVFENNETDILLFGKFNSILRNKTTGGWSNHQGAPIVLANRHTWVDTPGGWYRPSVQDDINVVNFSSAAWADFRYLANYKTNGARDSVIFHYEGNIIRDNMQTDSGKLLVRMTPADQAATINGFAVGIDLSQLNYPSGITGTPVAGGGTKALSSSVSNALSYVSW